MPGGWEALALTEALTRAVAEQEWQLPTTVQDEAIPLILGGGDVMVAAETGSGKTGAFVLPLLQLAFEQRGAEETAAAASAASSAPPSAPTPTASTASSSASGAAATVRLNTRDRTPAVAVSADGLVTQCRDPRAWGGVRGNTGVKQGCYYFEVTVRDEGVGRVGWCTLDATLELGCDRNGFGYGGTAMKSTGRKFVPYGEKYGQDDVLGCWIERAPGAPTRFAFGRNGNFLGVAFTVPAATSVGTLFPAVAFRNAELGVNFGDTPFKHAPAGYVCAGEPLGSFAAALGLVAAPAADVEVFAGGAMGLKEGPSRAAPRARGGRRTPLAIVLAPVRDLAEQTYQLFVEMVKFMDAPKLDITLLMGGIDTKKVIKELQRGTDIVVGTPARIADFIKTGKLDVGQMRFFVMDEADRLVGDRDTSRCLMQIYDALPKGADCIGADRLQVCFFSATLHSDEISDLSDRICHNPTWVDLKGKDAIPDAVHHVVVRVDPTAVESSASVADDSSYAHDGVHKDDAKNGGVSESDDAMKRASLVVKQLKPQLLRQLIDAHKMDQAMIFCRTNLDCDLLETYLRKCGNEAAAGASASGGASAVNPYACKVLAGGRGQSQRRAALAAFKSGEIRFLVCTDVAARGIDVKGLPYVINMTLPDEAENYIHRIGRVGRATCPGIAVSFVATCNEKVWYYDKRKWKNPKKLSPKLATDGGCCIWYDEPGMLIEVEARLKQPIQELGAAPEFAIPAKIARAREAAAAGVSIEVPLSDYDSHASEMLPTAQTLSVLEVQSQQFHLQMKTMFATTKKMKTNGGFSATATKDDLGAAEAAAAAAKLFASATSVGDPDAATK
jgi:ATP-dependent RNA helicase DDX1